MILKKCAVATLSIFLGASLLACQTVDTTTTTTLPLTETTTTTTTTENPCKATGWEYDLDSLEYNLVFFDEFDKDSGIPSILKWKYQTGDGGWGNNELQYYTDSGNAEIVSGNLVITARQEAMGDSLYTSARMNTQKSFLYGKVEVRAKLPSGSGTWPAIWMMPSASVYGGWPNSGEIDIMEHVGTDMNRVHFSIHTEKYYFKIGTQKTSVSTIPDVANTFHVYAIEWLPDMIRFLVDDVEKFRYVPSNYVACPTSEEWPFDKPFYLILNLAIGGWGGTPYPGFESESLVIDYVHISQTSGVF